MKNIMWVMLSFALQLMATAHAEDRQGFAPNASEVHPLLEGMMIPDVALQTIDNAPVSLRAITLQKPTVLLFYRGGWCPYCNTQLGELKTIENELVELGYQIVAVSPQSLGELNEQRQSTDFAATLYSDTTLEAMEKFGIAFEVDVETRKRYLEYGITLTENEKGQAVLPAPSLYIIDTSGTILFNYVNPDYTVRPSAKLVLSVAKALVKSQ